MKTQIWPIKCDLFFTTLNQLLEIVKFFFSFSNHLLISCLHLHFLLFVTFFITPTHWHCVLGMHPLYASFTVAFPNHAFVCFSLLVRNVITHSPCVICVWILWWSWTWCSGEQMTRWNALKNHVLKDVGTQCSDRMWHWGIGFYINCIKS